VNFGVGKFDVSKHSVIIGKLDSEKFGRRQARYYQTYSAELADKKSMSTLVYCNQKVGKIESFRKKICRVDVAHSPIYSPR
jgi:hypothetical protein